VTVKEQLTAYCKCKGKRKNKGKAIPVTGREGL
jgi:hypothetical protein